MHSTQMFIIVILASFYVLYCADFEFDSFEFPWSDIEFEFMNTPAVGKVYIGLGPGNESNEFKINENEEKGSVPVFLRLFNVTSRQPSDQLQDLVTVHCELTPSTPGYSRVQFTLTVVTLQGSLPVSFNVPYSILDAGRITDVRCWGESASGTSAARQFTKSLSISKPVLFTVRKRGTVSICSSQVQVSNRASTNTSTFILELSEPVEDFAVTVSCNSTSAVSGSNNLVLVFPTFVMTVGEVKKEVLYQRDKTAGTSPVYVTCRAQSQVVSGLGQFYYDTSAGPPVLFVLDEGKVKIEPSLTKLHSSRMELLLHLDAPVALMEVTFVCRATVVNTTEEAKDIAENPYCIAPVTASPVPPDLSPNDSEYNGTTVSNSLMNDTFTMADFEPEVTVSISKVSPETTLSDQEVFTTTVSSIAWQSFSNTTRNQLWQLQTENIVFQPGSIYRQLILERTSKPLQLTQELITVTCCAPGSNNEDPKYRQESATVFINAQMSGLVKIDWEAAKTTDTEQTETEIQNPAYVEFGPCPCDLTAESCDINCCCDSFCSEDQQSTFECILGAPGGRPGPQSDYMCPVEDYDTPDWHPFVCVHTNRSAFLGRFYSPVPMVDTLTDLLPLIEQNTPEYDYRETAPRLPSDELLVGGYKQSFSVMTGLKQNTDGNADLYIGANYRLTIPRKGYNGACLKTAPVQYLHDMQSDCTVQAAEELCRADSIWSARMYAENSDQTDPACPRSPQVLARHTSKTVTNTGVNYLCATDLTGYLHSFDNAEDVLPPNEQYKFAYEIPNGQQFDCRFDDVSSVYICPLEPTFNDSSDSLIRCSWDDGYTAPPVPEYDNTTGICRNVVLDAHYNFTWQGSTILELNATLVIGDVAMTTTQIESVEMEYENRTIVNGTELVDIITKTENITKVLPNKLTQKFGVNFYPLYIAPNASDYNITDNATDIFTTERYRRSGNPGYSFGESVLSGVAIVNETEGSFHYMDINDTYKFRLWEPGADGLCRNANSKVVTFGDNEMTTCLLRLGLEDFQDCNYLRRLVLSQQDALMTSEYISMVGDPNRFILTPDQWFQVLRENLTALFEDPSPVAMTTASNVNDTTEQMTTTEEIVTTVVVSESTTISNSSINDTTTEIPLPSDSYMEHLQGLCINIPSGIHLDILYTEAGQVNYKPIYNIRGVKISYKQSTWRMNCISGQGNSCYGNSTRNSTAVQTFFVSSSVRFTLVPLEKHPQKTRYQLKNDKACKQDSCWTDLFYPFQTNFPGDSRTYTIGFTLVAVLHIIGLYFITKPWW